MESTKLVMEKQFYYIGLIVPVQRDYPSEIIHRTPYHLIFRTITRQFDHMKISEIQLETKMNGRVQEANSDKDSDNVMNTDYV